MLSWCLFVTDALLICIANYRYGDLAVNVISSEPKLYPDADINRKWYVDCGSGIIVAMFLNMFFPHIIDLIKQPVLTEKRQDRINKDRYYSKLKNSSLSKNALSQTELNKLHKGPPFDMTLNYAVSINTIMVTLFFCSGMPILLLFASIQFTIKYYIDKFLVLYHYSRPEINDER